MNLIVEWLSFYVINQPDGGNAKEIRLSRHLTGDAYDASNLKKFLDGEFTKIAKRKAELNPDSHGSPTKLAQFVVEPGHSFESNPTYALLHRLLRSRTSEDSWEPLMELVMSYLKTPKVRDGVLLVVKATLDKFEDSFLFIIRCDFEDKTAVITDEASLISNVQWAISAKNIKSIMYPHLIEEGMIDPYHLKMHQFSHANYFEEFLKHIEFPPTVGEIVSSEVLDLAKQHIEYQYPDDSEERARAEEEIEIIAASPKRELAQQWNHHEVIEATQVITEKQPDLELKFKVGHVQVRSLLADYGSAVHIAKVGSKYAAIIVGDLIQFENAHSPVEFLIPQNLDDLVREIGEV